MAWAEGIEKATALIGASGAIPVIPNVLRSPLISPSTAVP
jgi:tetrahydromethanopterin S-methyltransferase subunit A